MSASDNKVTDLANHFTVSARETLNRLCKAVFERDTSGIETASKTLVKHPAVNQMTALVMTSETYRMELVNLASRFDELPNPIPGMLAVIGGLLGLGALQAIAAVLATVMTATTATALAPVVCVALIAIGFYLLLKEYKGEIGEKINDITNKIRNFVP